MRKRVPILFLWAILGLQIGISAQSGCPNCVVKLPSTLPTDTIYISDAPSGRAGQYYQADISFRMPKTTTPVAAVDPSVTPGITISQINITSVSNVPPGLNWQASKTEFNVATETDGCVRFCGTPLQPGLYEVEVVVTAKVFVVTQTTSFSFPILIEPAISITEGFTIENSSGCGEVSVDFKNNVPSKGRAGFSYQWNFGNGQTSLDENPSIQIYRNPGKYEVNYRAIVDTAGYTLTKLSIEKVSCTDLLNRPDLELEIYDPKDSLIYKSATFNNATLPLNFNLNLKIAEGNYKIRVTDDDDGLEGADDECGTVNFNRLSNGKLQGVDFQATINVLHPVDTIRSKDTVEVFAQPVPPAITGYNGNKLCKGDTVKLVSSYDMNLIWYKNDAQIVGASALTFNTTETGKYQVLYTSKEGCRAFSQPINLAFSNLPAGPVFLNNKNILTLFDPTQLPASYKARWFLNGAVIPGANGLSLCAKTSGNYVLEITDNATGCSSSFLRIVTFDPTGVNCTTGTEERFDALVNDLKIFPNPTNDKLWLQFGLNENSDVTVIVRNALGSEIYRQFYHNLLGNNQLAIELATQPAGAYFLELQVQDGRKNRRIVKQ